MCPDPNYVPESREVYEHGDHEYERRVDRLRGIAKAWCLACLVAAVVLIVALVFAS